MDIQRLRNLTTGKLHTEMGHIYMDLEKITGEKGLMTHMLPRVMHAVEPWLRECVTDMRFWDGKFDTTHTGTIKLPTPSAKDRKLMLERYAAQPDPLVGKRVVGALISHDYSPEANTNQNPRVSAGAGAGGQRLLSNLWRQDGRRGLV